MTTQKISRDAAKAAPKRNIPSSKPRIGIALAGGGPLGAMYEIGALAAIEESIVGLDVNDAAVYVGISAGSIIASGLANGITPHEMCRLFIESDIEDESGALFNPKFLLQPAWGEMRKRVAALPALTAGSLLHYLRRRGKGGFIRSFERMKHALPAGIFSGVGIHQFLEQAFSAPERTNDFRELGRRLILVATDLDSGESVRFGEPGLDHVPISKAAQASSAVPGLFSPVEIDGRHFVDGALRKTMHASIALDAGADVLICVNPIVPYNASGVHAPGKLSKGGMLTVLSQTLRATLHSRVEIGMAKYASAYPESDIFLFEPSQEDAEMFFANLFSTTNRRRICENAYQHTRRTLWQNCAEYDARLRRHGLRLKRSVLRDTSLTLVKNLPARRNNRTAATSLAETLDDLERHLKLVSA